MNLSTFTGNFQRRPIVLSCLTAVLMSWISASPGQTPAATNAAVRPAVSDGRGIRWPELNPKLPTLWIIGDSTVRNGQDNGNNGQWGWGNPIAAYFDQTRINIQNRAVGGTSSRTFYTTPAMWPAIVPLMKPGDFLIMQFGHNDGGAINDTSRARGTFKSNGEETQEIDNLLTHQHEVVHSYGWYLRKYISEAREKGVVLAIVCSPIPRNRWSRGTLAPDSYGPIAQQAAKQADARFFDLNALIIQKYVALGESNVTATLFPAGETTHTDWAGAVLNAECVIEGIKAQPASLLAQYLLPNPPKELKNPTGKAR
jgi:rhamnogalacturonan acetylesterase